MTKLSINRSTCVLALGAALAASACQNNATPEREQPRPATPPSSADKTADNTAPGARAPEPELERENVAGTSKTKDVMEEADSDMKAVLTELGALGAKSFSTLTPAVARKQASPADAVKKVLEKDKKPTAPLEMAKVEDRKIPGAKGPIAARIYTPKTDAKKPLPVIAYWHGGGFVVADLDTYDASPRALADEADAIVVSLDYRHAPENKFPAAHEDAFAGYQWVLKNAASFGGDPKRVAVAGESAGGNLAANVSIMARDKNLQLPVHQLLVYPVAQTGTNTESYREWGEAKPLDRASMEWFVKNYTSKPGDIGDSRLNLVSAKLDGLPKTTIVLAEIDPLRSDGELLAEKLEAAGVDVDTKTYDGVTHEFFGMGAVVDDAKSAEDYAGGRLKAAFKG
jgi:acetyl esterase/lipase